MTPIAPSILAAAMETYTLELASGIGQAEALERAIASALATQDRRTRGDVAEMAVSMARELDEDDDDLTADGPGALLWLAQRLHGALPQD